MNGREMARALGVTEKQLYGWVRRRHLRCARHDMGRWTGEEMWFGAEEQAVARRFVALTRAGLYPDAAAKVARGAPGALSRLLAAVGPCMGTGELRYRLPGAPGGSGGLTAEAEPCG